MKSWNPEESSTNFWGPNFGWNLFSTVYFKNLNIQLQLILKNANIYTGVIDSAENIRFGST